MAAITTRAGKGSPLTNAELDANFNNLNNAKLEYSFRNRLINGNFDIWQRGTSLGNATGGRYLADRWLTDSVGTSNQPSQQPFGVGQGVVPYEPTYFHRVGVSSVAGSGNYSLMSQRVEGARTLAGQSAVLSFWAKADASKNMVTELSQYFGTGGSPSAQVIGIGATTCALTTAWQKFTIPVTLPSISGKTFGNNGDDQLQVVFWFDAGSNFNARTNSLGQQSGTFDIAQVQLEPGSVAQSFEVRHIQKELALCQRYYELQLVQNTICAVYASGFCAASNVQFKANKRAIPTVSVSGLSATSLTGIAYAGNSYATQDQCGMVFTTSSAVGTVGTVAYTGTFNSEL